MDGMTEDRRGTPPLEIWGGPECTIVRIGERWRDQAIETGHRSRVADHKILDRRAWHQDGVTLPASVGEPLRPIMPE